MTMQDPWAVRKLDGAAVPGPYSPSNSKRIRSIALLWLAAAILQTVNLAFATTASRVNPFERDYATAIATETPAILVFVLLGVGLLAARKRTFWLGLSLSIAVCWIPSSFGFVHLVSLQRGIMFTENVFFASFVAGAIAGILTAVELFGERTAEAYRPTTPAPPAPTVRRTRLYCLTGGLLAVLASGAFFGSMISITYRSPFAGNSVSQLCCSFVGTSGWDQAADVTGFLAAIGLVVAAAFTRSRDLSIAYFLGSALFSLPEISRFAFQPFAPAVAVYGTGGAAILNWTPSNFVTVSYTIDFWLTVLSFLIFAAVAWFRSRIGRPTPFPSADDATPLTTDPAGMQA